MLPPSLTPCPAPLDRVLSDGTCSGRDLASAGRLNNTQCTHVLRGASGSSIMSAMDFVAVGTLFHASGGEIFMPSHVYLLGIKLLSLNALLVRFIFFFPNVLTFFFAQQQQEVERANIAIKTTIIRFIPLIPLSSAILKLPTKNQSDHQDTT